MLVVLGAGVSLALSGLRRGCRRFHASRRDCPQSQEASPPPLPPQAPRRHPRRSEAVRRLLVRHRRRLRPPSPRPRVPRRRPPQARCTATRAPPKAAAEHCGGQERDAPRRRRSWQPGRRRRGRQARPRCNRELLQRASDPGDLADCGGTRVIPLVPVGAATGARGQLTWEPIGGGVLVVSGLPQPPTGRTYQLWLGSISLGNRVSAGLLMVDAQGAGTLRVAAAHGPPGHPISSASRWSAKGGAREPSDDLVLVGELPGSGDSRKAPGAPAAGPRRARIGRAGRAGAPPTPSRRSRPRRAAPPRRRRRPGARPSPAPAVRLPTPVAARRPRLGARVRVVPVPMERTWPSPSRSCGASAGTSTAPIRPRASSGPSRAT